MSRRWGQREEGSIPDKGNSMCKVVSLKYLKEPVSLEIKEQGGVQCEISGEACKGQT